MQWTEFQSQSSSRQTQGDMDLSHSRAQRGEDFCIAMPFMTCSDSEAKRADEFFMELDSDARKKEKMD